ncbi:biotin synthase BioB [candidate division WOR-1 bacterium RIFCSPHIGHO2_01_FULL_53_15]|uniref:Biotin synthase n=1 Tax=candidate division WOR-1 bacterium RIFCSPHIGHO2_01_FULL_53_15 TaxID=1802564 RepID=A0A1F4Q544_UNCSA|nr:MAG: biotin synthase BioB [candidate division WOR-1 bacterium RIFCSPHIGHO2_01_FULL_53_15]OGC10308.1 MAG: biotin synthase BioB [candidate division WOR-1 bacterium RIFCSPHIGHO2_02_FULL_53_26]
MNYQELAERAIAENGVSQADAIELINTPNSELLSLLTAAEKIRRHFKGNKVKLCGIVNAKSGRCSEDCSFCAQSAHHKTDCRVYPLMSKAELVTAAKTAEKHMSATCFSFVTSGKTVHSDSELRTLGSALTTVARETDLNRCVSLGTLNHEQINDLKQSGLKRLHHNLETAESFFPQMCTTHSYAERLKTIRLAKEAGLETCSGGIFGLGETPEQRIELAFTLKELDVVSVPINILNPVKGTPAAKNYKPMTPFEVLKLVAAYRFCLPDKDIGVFGGREKALGTLQPLMFIAGANVTLVGDYLTTKGQSPEQDLKMISDLGLEIGQS